MTAADVLELEIGIGPLFLGCGGLVIGGLLLGIAINGLWRGWGQ